jgi:hypothetical protein
MIGQEANGVGISGQQAIGGQKKSEKQSNWEM